MSDSYAFTVTVNVNCDLEAISATALDLGNAFGFTVGDSLITSTFTDFMAYPSDCTVQYSLS